MLACVTMLIHASLVGTTFLISLTPNLTTMKETPPLELLVTASCGVTCQEVTVGKRYVHYISCVKYLCMVIMYDTLQHAQHQYITNIHNVTGNRHTCTFPQVDQGIE